METTKAERVRLIIKYYGMPIQKFAEMMGVSQSTLSNQFARNSITLDTIDFICNNFKDINIRWLLNGEGDMFTEVVSEDLANVLIRVPEEHKPEPQKQQKETIEERQQRMIDQLIQLGIDSQARMIRINEIVDKLAGVCEAFASNITRKECECAELRKEVASVHVLLSEIVRNMCHVEGKQINFHNTNIDNQNI